MAGAPSSLSQKVPDKRYLILTYSVEFDRYIYIHILSVCCNKSNVYSVYSFLSFLCFQ